MYGPLVVRLATPLAYSNQLGSGAQGSVYEAEFNGSVVAAKRIRWNDANTARRAMNEVQLHSRLIHHNVIRMLAWHEQTVPPEVQLIMELADGGTLRALIGRNGLPVATIKVLAKQLACGLGYLHSTSIAHLDLKAQNILVKNDTLKISDFGTLQTRAPEHILGGYGVEADVWSFACVVYEMAEAALPYYGMPHYEIIRHVGGGNGPNMPDLPDTMKELLSKCWTGRDERLTAEQVFSHPSLL